jgi:hypothetical protein
MEHVWMLERELMAHLPGLVDPGEPARVTLPAEPFAALRRRARLKH